MHMVSETCQTPFVLQEIISKGFAHRDAGNRKRGGAKRPDLQVCLAPQLHKLKKTGIMQSLRVKACRSFAVPIALSVARRNRKEEGSRNIAPADFGFV